jgi:trk system potassium uptake protein TrkH
MFAWGRIRPELVFIGSFVLLIAVGTVGLQLIPGVYSGAPLSWLDAFFTATSAVCVTGLVVADTGTAFTSVGQAWILLLIQLGGLGMITVASLVIVALNQRLSFRAHTLTAGITVLGTRITARDLITRIVLFTGVIELVGTVILWVHWELSGVDDPLGAALFHSISAFCNAGFSTWSNSLIGFRDDPFTLIVIAALIILGGIGFVVMSDLRQWWSTRRDERRHAVSLHSRITLLSTLILLVVGGCLFGIFEWNGLFGDLGAFDRVVNSMFMSVTPRTAGFNTIDYAIASNRSLFLTIILMAIGGSPGSTAGGLKTTTLAIIVLSAWSRLRGRLRTSFRGRTLPDDTVRQAVGLFVLLFSIISLGLFAYISVDPSIDADRYAHRTFLPYMFEAASAVGTAGLSMGVTPDFGTPGKIFTIIMMFAGRVGPLSLVAAFAIQARGSVSAIRYPKEDVMIG